MQDLKNHLEAAKIECIGFYRNSGNLFLEASGSAYEVERKISGIGKKLTKKDIEVFLRTKMELQGILSFNPFKDCTGYDHWKKCVSLLKRTPEHSIGMKCRPLNSVGDVVLLRTKRREAFSLWNRKNGSFGVPNGCVEKKVGVKATTRSWGTLEGMAKKFSLNE
jgi:uncharacterized protein (DUF1697 family)